MSVPQNRTASSSPGAGPEKRDAAAPAPDAAEGKRPREAMIVFLCPNGHKLNGPARLAGRPGQCPHCGARFKIPSIEELRAAQQEAAQRQVEDPTENLVPDEELVDDLPAPPPEPDVEVEELDEFDDEMEVAEPQDYVEVPAADDVGIPHVIEAEHALGTMFNYLWEQRGEDAVVELHLPQGEVLVPELYSPDLSAHSHGVFAVRVEDGSFTITSVPWNAVSKAVLKKVDRLPRGLFH